MKTVEIAPATGKLGILLVGLGAVSTTVIAGVLAIRRGLSKPIGSLSQMGTLRLGKRTDNRSPRIADVLPLAGLDDVVFGGMGSVRRQLLRGGQDSRRARGRTCSSRSGPSWKRSSRGRRSSTAST